MPKKTPFIHHSDQSKDKFKNDFLPQFINILFLTQKYKEF